ncbi:MAG: Pr6Pr family membrane protein [Candidatus Limnocylindrales bacterium]
MIGRQVLGQLRVGFGLFAFVAIGAQIADLLSSGHFNPVNFFSFFTIDSNLLGATMLLVAALRWRSERSRRADLLRGAAVVYLSVTFIVFALLLANSDVDLALPWVDFVLHKLMPVVVALDWLIDPPVQHISLGQALLWLSFPAMWIVYTLIRGPLAGWYPYPFLDPSNGGYGTVALYCVGILALMTVTCLVVMALANTIGPRLQRADPRPAS